MQAGHKISRNTGYKYNAAFTEALQRHVYSTRVLKAAQAPLTPYGFTITGYLWLSGLPRSRDNIIDALHARYNHASG